MAFDPLQEDCQRLILQNMRRENISITDEAYVERCLATYEGDPAPLIKTDRDRSFHLTARAAVLADYRVPFLTDETEADRQEDLAVGYLEEAVELDDRNWDARRMLAEIDAESTTGFVSYLSEHVGQVLEDAHAAADEARSPFERELAVELETRPYLRWLATLSSRLLIAGRYRASLEVAEQSLALAPTDPAGVRHTGMLSLAKLEADQDELQRFRRRHAVAYQAGSPLQRRHHLSEKRPDPWTLLAQLSAAWRAFDNAGARKLLGTLVRSCPNAAQALYQQMEFPEGLYSRVAVTPGSDDELILAISEATPLLQEGLGAPDNASFAVWIAEHEVVTDALDEKDRANARNYRAPRPSSEN